MTVLRIKYQASLCHVRTYTYVCTYVRMVIWSLFCVSVYMYVRTCIIYVVESLLIWTPWNQDILSQCNRNMYLRIYISPLKSGHLSTLSGSPKCPHLGVPLYMRRYVSWTLNLYLVLLCSQHDAGSLICRDLPRLVDSTLNSLMGPGW